MRIVMTTKRRRRSIGLLTVATLATAPVLAACGSDSEGGSGSTISYWLWDSAQQPGYQKCADAFHAANPSLTVQITQYGWNDYWSKLTAGFIADTAPDVFTNHLNYFAQFADLKVLRPLDQLGPTKDIKNTDYQPGLAELWFGQDGHRYGAPKDWDTISIFYNKKAIADAGMTEQQLASLTWNPDDGGTFEKAVAHLTVDVNGRRGDQPGFDKARVKTYGWASDGGGGGGWGQTQWSPFTGSVGGWTVTDKNPWGTTFHLDDPRFQKTIGWFFDLQRKGYMPSYQTIGGSSSTVGPDKQMQMGTAAMGFNGSWMISTFAKLTDADGKKIEIGIVPTPVGPSGKRASMFNGLADSITTQAKNPEAAAKWVSFLAGQQCQDLIGGSGVVFPARPSGTELAVRFNKDKRGLDVTPFTDQVKDKTTFLFPVTGHAADITALLKPAFDGIYIGSAEPSSLTEVNRQIEDLFKVGS